MQRIVEQFVQWSGVLVPMMALWAIALVYTLKAGHDSTARHASFFFVMLVVASATLRTVLVNDGCWLVHTASLSTMILAGVLRRPDAHLDDGLESLQGWISS